jgi:PAS domain S-box-containing protein
VTGVTVLSIRREHQNHKAELEQQASLLLATLAASLADPLYTSDADQLTASMEMLGRQALNGDPQILASGRVYNSNGRIIADAYDPDLAFSSQIDRFGQQLVESDTIVFKWQDDRLVAGRAVDVDGQRLGAVSVGLSTSPLQAKIITVRDQGIVMAISTVVIGVLLAVVLSRSNTGPLQDLVTATERIAQGDLNQQITIESGDDLAILGYAMERMRAELLALYEGLEQEVADRTQELRVSEERFRKVVSSLSDHIYMSEYTANSQHINHYLSPNIEKLTGYPHERFMADWSFWPTRIIHPDDRAAAAAQAKRFAQGQNSEVEYRLMRADGQIIWVRDSGEIRSDPDNQSIFVFGVVSDITARKRAEEEVALARDQALEANAFKTSLLANVSHDLRTPLGAILGYTEILHEGLYGHLTVEQRDITQRIMRSIKNLANMVSDLLDQAKLETGGMTLIERPFDIDLLVDQILSTVQVLAENKGIRLVKDIASDMPTSMYGDADQLQRILNNLVGNAIKFTEQGSVKLRIYRADVTHWALEVSDTGPGIPSAAQSYIFEPFRQIDGSVTRLHGGSGLGLSIVKQLADLMGGEVWLESRAGQGCKFTVLLPLTTIQEIVS